MTARPAPRNPRVFMASNALTHPRERPRSGFAGVWYTLTIGGLLLIAVSAELMR